MTRFLAISALLLASALMAAASAFSVCPNVGADTTGCQLLINVLTVNGSSVATSWTVTTNPSNFGPFDGVEDTLIGITNSAAGTLTSITLTGGLGSGVFGFDADGACTGLYSPTPTAAMCHGGVFTSTDPADYESAGATFSNYASLGTGTVNVDLANGASTWFDLEGVISAQQLAGGVPEPGSVMLLGSGLAAFLGLAWRRRRAQR